MAQQENIQRKKWEYRFIVSEEHEELEKWIERLNAFGADGWELVGIIPETARNFIAAYFKRERNVKKEE